MRTRIGRGSVADGWDDGKRSCLSVSRPRSAVRSCPMSGLAERNGGRAGLVTLVVILLLGLGLRVNEAWDGRPPVFDAAAYATIAANLDRGEGFTLGPSA